ncbi:flagellar hook-associated protein FlgK [Fodinicurvata sediminis]|uniref:flagellar hook-associated protein FlgK n=1 Tax=Fodinicurvata sediminis TaxID=1121832 RepID=UPI0003B4F7F4|nr:flagellar hook-associated protein FlgK [Fodinicurvata sediminis]
MSLNVALNNAFAGLRLSQAGTEVASSNIANAQDPSYSRKVLQHSSHSGVGLSGPYLEGVERRVADRIAQDVRGLTSQAAGNETRAETAERLGEMLNIDADTPRLQQLFSDFETALRDFEATPESNTMASRVINTADALAKEVNHLYAETESLEQEIRSQVDKSVEQLNEKLLEIEKLNKEIAGNKALGETVGNLEDRRDAAIKEVSELVDTRVLMDDQGRAQVYTSSGTQLVGISAQQFSWDGDDIIKESDGNTVTNAFKDGEIGARLRMLDDTLVGSNDPAAGTIQKLKDQLNDFAVDIRTTVNDAYGGAGDIFFQTPAAPGAGTLQVKPAILNGTEALQNDAGGTVSQALIDDNIGGQLSGIIENTAGFKAESKHNLENATASRDAMEAKFRGKVGVDVDQEMADLIALQNAYAANARVMQTVNDMMNTLMGAVGR